MVKWPWQRREPASVIVQATNMHASTPTAQAMDLVEMTSQVVNSTALPIINPDPLSIELLFTHSHELSSIERSIRQKVWRQGLKVESRWHATCAICGYHTDRELEVCPKCQGTTFLLPDEAGKKRLEDFAAEANLDGEGLIEVGEDGTADGLKHGRIVLILRHDYLLDEEGVILTARLREVRRGSPGYIRIVRDSKTGRKGNRWWVCLNCRSNPNYQAESVSGRCRTCKGVTYEAWYIETTNWGSTVPKQWFLRNEVYESPFYYRDGTPPVLRVWHKSWFFVFADYYARMAFDPRGDKRPDKIATFMGVNPDSVRKWLREEAERKKNNPYVLSTMVLPSVDLAGGNTRQDAKVLDLGDDVVKGQALELRESFKSDLRSEFGIMPLAAGDVSQVGGLNAESEQREEGAEIIEHLQQVLSRCLDRISEALGEKEWQYRFEDPYEENESQESDTVQKQLDIATAAEKLGLTVRWEGGRAKITDGPIDSPAPEFPGIPGLQDEGGDPFGVGREASSKPPQPAAKAFPSP